ncbi:MAG: hypothetical protein Q9183_003537 [Haloplaca sp. 2 TL-2023]
MSEPPTGPPPASAATEQSRLKGHLGHLTPQEETALTEFKKLSADAGYFRPETDTQPASHDDGTLIRYLRARKFVAQDAFAQFKDTEIWRKENNLDALYEKIDISDYQEARSVYPQWTGRRDKRGIPVYLYEVGKLDSKKMIAYSQATSKSKTKGPSPSRMLRLFALYENLTRFVMPLCSAVPGRPNPETPVDQSNNIVDISKVGLKQFWNLKSHMQDASQLATAHYPETLDRIFIIGAPSFFPTVWGWIKRWFDPITTSKIFILSQEQVKPTLSAFMDVSSIPKKYGGELDFECGMMPSIDPEIRKCMDLKNPKLEELLLTGPTRWIDNEEGEMTALSVGSIDGNPHKEAIAIMHSWAVMTATNSRTFSTQRVPTLSSSMQPGSKASSRPQSEGEALPSTRIQPSPLQQVQAVPSSQASIPTTSQPPSNQMQPHQNMRPSVDNPALTELRAESQPSTNATIAPESESVLPNGSTMKSEPVLPNGQNGEALPPKTIEMPPAQLQRAETQYMTPATEPSEMKHFH